jgi:DeoR/GlpR family transcriptional regulator of sugar metabolism
VFAEERRQAILALLSGQSRVEVGALAQRFKVSEDTIRRDLRALASTGFFQKTHGGAVALNVASLDWQARTQIQPELKERIGRAAAALVSPQETVILDAGLTVLALARQLKARPVTAITNSLDVAAQLANDPAVSLVVTGGQWDSTARYLSGDEALKVIAAHRADWVFLGTCALHPEAGLTVQHAPDATMKRAMLAVGLRTVLLVDHTKFGGLAPHYVAPVASVHTIVTDRKTPWLAKAGPRVIVA